MRLVATVLSKIVPLGYTRSSLLSPLKFPSRPVGTPTNSCGTDSTKLKRPRDDAVIWTLMSLVKETKRESLEILSRETRGDGEAVLSTFVTELVMLSELKRTWS